MAKKTAVADAPATDVKADVKSDVKMDGKSRALSDALAQITKQYGEGSIRKLGDESRVHLE